MTQWKTSITSFTITQTPGSNFSDCVRSSYLFLMLDCRPAVSWLMVDWSFLLLCNDFMRIALYEKKEVKITFTFHKIAGYIFQFYYLFQWRGNVFNLKSTFTFHFLLLSLFTGSRDIFASHWSGICGVGRECSLSFHLVSISQVAKCPLYPISTSSSSE